jgi:hypothetical protein
MNPSFYCEYHRDITRLERAVASLRRIYPSAPLTLVCDGGDVEFARGKFGDKTFLVEGGRLFLPERGYEVIQRRIDLWSQMQTSHIVCFDTDVLFHKPFTCEYPRNLPFVYGKIWQREDGKFGIRGGAYGMTIAAAEQMKEKFDPAKLPEVKTYNRPGYEEKTIWVDNAMIEMFQQCEIRKRLCCDFGVHAKYVPKGNFSVTHPHKDDTAPTI